MSARKSSPLVGALAGALVLAPVCLAAPPLKFSGSIAGMVSNSAGVPQLGATVLLYNRFDRLLQKSLTNDKGAFTFTSLVPDVYAVRVSMATFLPALKRDIVVQPGMQSLLSVNLTSVFSSIELVALAPGQNALMSDEWKWVLRSAAATRPLLRYLPGIDPGARRTQSAFSGTRGMVKVSAGDQAAVSNLGTEPDLGTAFALATSFLGNNHLQVSGNVGYAPNSGAPAAAFRTSYKRDAPGGTSPEVQVTMRQVHLPARAGAAFLGGVDRGSPVLRSVSATFFNEAKLADGVLAEYGASMDSVMFLDNLNYFSPFGRLTIDAGDDDAVVVGYASGTPPAEIFLNEGGSAVEMQQDLAALALFPRVSIAGGRVRVQRSQSLEVGYRKTVGSRTYSFAAHREGVSNAALTLVGPEGFEPGANLVPDLFSRSWIVNAGRYRSTGYVASITQSLGKNLDATLAFGSSGALTAKPGDLAILAELRDAITTTRRHSLTARVSGSVPTSGTQFVTSYQWANVDALTPPHLYLTQRVREGLGWNVHIRQPLPRLGGLPGRFEANADLRNLLAQGYVPLNVAGRRVVMVHTPRSVRGGVSFIF